MTFSLVTGGCGFIGSHTVDILLERGHRVRVLDSLQPRVHPEGTPAWTPSDAELVVGDVANADALGCALEGVECVFHLAAYQDYMPDFSRFMHVNAESAALLFELAVADRRKYPVRKVVFASSQAVCGEGRFACPSCAGMKVATIAEQLERGSIDDLPEHAVHNADPRPIEQLARGEWDLRCPRCGSVMQPLLTGEDVVKPGTAYGISKYAIELLADRLGSRYGIDTTCMRYTYVQGLRNSFYNAYSGVARRFALQIHHGLPPVVYEDGAQLRDYVNVADVARANVLAMEDERALGVYNVGGGRAVTVLELARMMLEAFGSRIEPEVSGEFRVGDTRHTVSDISRLRRLGWEPTIPAEESVGQYAAWIREQSPEVTIIEHADVAMRASGVIRRITR